MRSSNPPSDTEQILAEIARDPAKVLTRFLPEIRRIAAWVGRRQGLEVEELEAHVHLRLLENDCARLRSYVGRSSFETFLSVCIQHLARDLRDKALGSWEPSAEARRIGSHAVRLETLWVRDGLSLDEVERTLAPHFPDLTRKEIEEIAVRLPVRARRRLEGDEGLDRRPAPTPTPDLQLEEREGFAARREILAVLGEELAELAAEDRLLVELRVVSGFKVSEIARQCATSLGVDQKALYPRFEKIFATLKRRLGERGISSEDALLALRLSGRDEEELP